MDPEQTAPIEQSVCHRGFLNISADEESRRLVVIGALRVKSLHRQVVCNVPVSCIANKDRNQLGAWLNSKLIFQ